MIFYSMKIISIEFEWPVPSSPGPLGHIEPASATVDDPEMQLAMCTYTLSSTFAVTCFGCLFTHPLGHHRS